MYARAEAVNQSMNNGMAKREKDKKTMIYKTLYRKSEIEEQQHHKTQEVTIGPTEG
jgi:hypothetical protein